MTSATISTYEVASGMTSEIGGAENWKIVLLADQTAMRSGSSPVGAAKELEGDSAATDSKTVEVLHRLWKAGAIKTHQAVSEARTLIQTLTMCFVPQGAAQAPQSVSEERPTAEQIVDWEAHLASAPARQRGQIDVELQYRGRGKPSPSANPWE